MSLSIYSKASTDSLVALKANLSGATFTGAVTAPGLTITSGSGAVLTFADGTTQSTAATGGGGGATWGSITGSISAQTDLQTEFGNYLLLAGGTLSGAVYSNSIFSTSYLSTFTTVAPSGLTAYDGTNTTIVQGAGVVFTDSTIQTTAATAFNGGTVSNPLTIDSATSPQLYVTDSTHTTTPTLVVTDGTNATTITQNGVGAPGITVGTTGITFADSTTQTTAFTAGTFLPLSGGAMTGALTLGGDLNGGGYNLTDCNFNSSAGQVNCQNLTLTNGDGGSVTFADGSVQTTAASGGSSGLDAFGAFYAGICSTLYGMLQTWNYYYSPMQFVLQNSGSGQPFSGPSFALTSGNIGITSDGVNFYPIDQYQPNGSNIYIASSTYSGSPSGVYLAFKDGSGTWHQCPINFA